GRRAAGGWGWWRPPAANGAPVRCGGCRPSGSPLWAILLVGLGGGLLGGTGAYFGARRSARSLRQSAEEALKHERTRLLNERFSTAAELLGHGEAACRLAGVHAMAGLADDWTERRQTCIGVLCAYLRMPYPPKPDETAPSEQHLAWQANREIRHTVIRTIRDHLTSSLTPPEASWNKYHLDLTGTVFDGGDFTGAKFSGGTLSFARAQFAGGEVKFRDAEFSGGEVKFRDAEFSGGEVNFDAAKFSGGEVNFRGAHWTTPPTFDNGVLAAPPAGLLPPRPQGDPDTTA
ncbi:pentapeptide repeat-containing protein, partial [Streptomyces sp. NPDC050534]|uniref:pentapeptide repeat-containing protein n=1 Tax=Streptomyces sp. NPDC050534 TaxID=3365625 RepID=UPI00378B5380